jgi:hypothetical protein
MTSQRRFDRRRPMSSGGAGVMFIALGAILLVQQLHWRPDLDMRHLWPVLPMVFGAVHLWFPNDDGFAGGMTGLLVGVIFLLNNFGVASIRNTWPLFIVVGGLGILIGSLQRNRRDIDKESDHVN